MDAGRSPLLDIRELSVSFGSGEGSRRTVVDGVSLRVERGETVGIVGESGCGKSVTALSIPGLLGLSSGHIEGGSIRFNGEELIGKRERELAKLRGSEIAMVFQEPMTALNPAMTIGKQLVEAFRLHQKGSRKAAKEQAIASLVRVGIPNAAARMSSYPYELSGGQRQRVMIAMALLCGPQLLIADEPTTALDVTIQAQILDTLKALKQHQQMAILLITHDFGVIADMADRVVVMYAGQVVEEGSVREVLQQPLHPYTQGLLRSIPRLGPVKERLYAIPGSIASARHGQDGCAFASRCGQCAPVCLAQAPPLRTSGPGRSSRCWLGTAEYAVVEYAVTEYGAAERRGADERRASQAGGGS